MRLRFAECVRKRAMRNMWVLSKHGGMQPVEAPVMTSRQCFRLCCGEMRLILSWIRSEDELEIEQDPADPALCSALVGAVDVKRCKSVNVR